MDDGYPLVEAAAFVHAFNRRADILNPELVYQLMHGFLELAVERSDLAFPIGGNGVLSSGQRVVMDNPLKIRQHQAGGRAKCTKLFIDRVQRPVGVRFLEHRVHQVGNLVQPEFYRRVFSQVFVGRCQTKPRAGRARHAGHHPGGKHPKAARAGVVVDVVVALPALVTVLDEKPPRSWQQVVTDIPPVTDPASALAL